jgi:hypothetical protein
MRIIGKAARLFTIDGVNLVPGSNIVAGEDEKRLKESAYFKEMCRCGNFQVVDEKPAAGPKDVVKEMNVAEKVAVVAETLTDAELDKLEEGETRKGVLKAIEAQREKIREGRDDEGDDE